MPSSITYEYLSCAVQRTAHVADWVQWGEGRDALVLGVHKAVAVWLDPSEPAARAPAVHMWPLPCQETVHVLKAWPDHVTRIVVGTYEGGLELWRVHGDELCCDASVQARMRRRSPLWVSRATPTRASTVRVSL